MKGPRGPVTRCKIGGSKQAIATPAPSKPDRSSPPSVDSSAGALESSGAGRAVVLSGVMGDSLAIISYYDI
jgi:hypothetical protein